MDAAGKPTLAVWKFASCDGCQLSLLDSRTSCSRSPTHLEIAYFLEASSATVEGPYDVSLVEGSITTAHDAERIREVRASSRALITIGACATAGGIQALRNFADVEEFTRIVYASPDYISTLATSTPISAHVPVDFELHGCPINKRQLLEVISAHLNRRRPRVRAHSVCVECKRRGTVCVMVAHGTPCLGPVTHAGCGALCPAYDRGCYGCYGPKETPEHRVAGRVVRARGPRPGPRLPHVQRRAPSRSARRARRMSDEASRTRTIRTDYLARVEGEGGMYVKLEGREVQRRQAADLRAAAVLRGVPARPRVHRGARHHRADLRHLPGRLPDERGAGDGGRVRGRDRRRADPRPAPAALLRRVDREPQPARVHAARARLPRLRGRVEMARDHPEIVEQGLQMKKAGQRADDAGRRPRGPSDQRPRRRLLPGADPGRAAQRWSTRSSGPARPRSRRSAGPRR